MNFIILTKSVPKTSESQSFTVFNISILEKVSVKLKTIVKSIITEILYVKLPSTNSFARTNADINQLSNYLII